MNSLLIFDIPGEKQSDKVKVSFPGGFWGIVEKRFEESIAEVLSCMLTDFITKYPERSFEVCPADLTAMGVLVTKTETVWTDEECFTFTDDEYQKLVAIVSKEEIIFPWEKNPCNSVSNQLLDEIWHGDVANFVRYYQCANIIDIGDNDEEHLIVLRDFKEAISHFSPKIRLSFQIIKEISNPASGKIIQWKCNDIATCKNSQSSLDQYAWQLMDSDRKPVRFAGFRDFEDVVNFIRAA